jgi:hypothetical protein
MRIKISKYLFISIFNEFHNRLIPKCKNYQDYDSYIEYTYINTKEPFLLSTIDKIEDNIFIYNYYMIIKD